MGNGDRCGDAERHRLDYDQLLSRCGDGGVICLHRPCCPRGRGCYHARAAHGYPRRLQWCHRDNDRLRHHHMDRDCRQHGTGQRSAHPHCCHGNTGSKHCVHDHYVVGCHWCQNTGSSSGCRPQHDDSCSDHCEGNQRCCCCDCLLSGGHCPNCCSDCCSNCSLERHFGSDCCDDCGSDC